MPPNFSPKDRKRTSFQTATFTYFFGTQDAKQSPEDKLP